VLSSSRLLHSRLRSCRGCGRARGDTEGAARRARPTRGDTRAWHFSASWFLVPLILMISASFVVRDRHQHLRLLASAANRTFAAYQYILNDPSQILSAYAVTVTVTARRHICRGADHVDAGLSAVSRTDSPCRRRCRSSCSSPCCSARWPRPLYIPGPALLGDPGFALGLDPPYLVMPWSCSCSGLTSQHSARAHRPAKVDGAASGASSSRSSFRSRGRRWRPGPVLRARLLERTGTSHCYSSQPRAGAAPVPALSDLDQHRDPADEQQAFGVQIPALFGADGDRVLAIGPITLAFSPCRNTS